MTEPTLTRLRLLEDALRALGINPDADPLVTAKRWTGERDADRRERSKAEAAAAALQDHLTDEIDRRKDVEAQLAQVTAERDAALAAPAQRLALLDDLLTRLGAKRGGALEALDRLDLTIETLRGERDAERAHVVTLNLHKKEGIEAINAARADLAKMTDAHAVVSQRLVGAQKEVAERDATIDELRTALESIAANVGLVGSGQWAVGDVVVKVAEVTARADKMTTQAKELRVSFAEFERRGQQIESDDELRSQLAVAVGLDDSASLALILDTVTRDRPGREISRLSGLLDVLAAPVAFGGHRLSTAERAEWALRRWLAEGKECSARMAQLIDAEVYLDCVGVPAYAAVPSDDPGDASEALTVAERLRLHFGARS